MFQDHRGTEVLTTTETGAIKQWRVFEPFGEKLASWTDTAFTDQRFEGHRWDEDLSLYNFQARWYDSDAGRLMSVDPLILDPGDPQNHNPYGYVRNNPVNMVDPTGMAPGVMVATVTFVNKDGKKQTVTKIENGGSKMKAKKLNKTASGEGPNGTTKPDSGNSGKTDSGTGAVGPASAGNVQSSQSDIGGGSPADSKRVGDIIDGARSLEQVRADTDIFGWMNEPSAPIDPALAQMYSDLTGNIAILAGGAGAPTAARAAGAAAPAVTEGVAASRAAVQAGKAVARTPRVFVETTNFSLNFSRGMGLGYSGNFMSSSPIGHGAGATTGHWAGISVGLARRFGGMVGLE
jgi:RHS repeat-associated protein